MTAHPLEGYRLLVVEDEYYLAMELGRDLVTAGATVLGPVPSIREALSLIDGEATIHAALLDLNLGGEMAYPVAEALRARKIPFVFTTGYSDIDLHERFADVIRCEKPFEFTRLLKALASTLTDSRGAAGTPQLGRASAP